MPAASLYVSSTERQVTPKRRVTGSEKAAATEPYMLRVAWDRSAKFLRKNSLAFL